MTDLPEPFDPTTAPFVASYDNLPDIPAIALLKSRPQWVSWDYEYREGSKPTKPPISPRSGFKASHSRPDQWGEYSEAVTRVVRSGLEGVGYVLTEHDNLSGGDLDNCRDEDTGVIQPWAAEIISFAETYAEISPSGKGIRILWLGKISEAIKCDPMGVEVYGKQRYLTITGDHIAGTPIEIREAPRTEAALRARVARFRAETTAPPAEPTSSGDDFFRKVNTACLADLASWVPTIFPMARLQNGTQAWRVPAKSLGDDFQEDLSISPRGAVYFGVHDMGDPRQGKRTPISLAIEFGGQRDAIDAAHWLCDRIGRHPAFFGWREDNAAKGAELANSLLAKTVNRDEFDATPWAFVDPMTMSRRQWLYGKHYIRKFVTTTISPGGIGKTSLVLAEAIAMVTGRAILGVYPDELARVWVWNGEDPVEEIQKRVVATCLHYGVDQAELKGLFVDSGRNLEIVIAEQARSGAAKICAPIFENVVRTILKHKIDVFIVDPFVSSHQVNENDNNSIDLVAKSWARIADVTNCSIELIHHARKTGGGEVTVEHARGAVALTSAARSARTLNGMSDDEEAKAGKAHVQDRRQFFRVDHGKDNLALSSSRSVWFKLESVRLPNSTGGILDNGDEIGVPTPWEWPGAAEEDADLDRVREIIGSEPVWRSDPRSPLWAGHGLGDVFGVDSMSPVGKARIAAALRGWLETGELKIINAPDKNRAIKGWIVVKGEQE